MLPSHAAAGRHQPQDGVRWTPAARELVGGVLAGAVNVTSGYPFDTMKVRLQASTGGTTMAQCFLHIWRNEGVSTPSTACTALAAPQRTPASDNTAQASTAQQSTAQRTPTHPQRMLGVTSVCDRQQRLC